MPSQPSLEVDVLRAMLRLARRRTTATIEQLLVRVPADEPAVRRTLDTLIRAELVRVTPKGPRLSLVGFAVAVAMAATPRHAAVAKTTTVPMRRRRAA